MLNKTLVTFVLSILVLIWTGSVAGALALGLFSYILLDYVEQLGVSLPLLELISMMAAAQWLLGPFLAYRVDFDHWRYQMYVSEEVYMTLSIPAVLIFFITLKFIGKTNHFQSTYLLMKDYANRYPWIGIYLLGFGLIMPYLLGILPPAFRFLGFLVSNLRYVGIAFLLLSNQPNKWYYFYMVLFITVIDSVSSGLFHDLILWSALLVSFISIEQKWQLRHKAFLIIGGLLLIVALQGVKGQYRKVAGLYQDTEDRIEVFSDLMVNQFSQTNLLFEEAYLGIINVRLNQGWIISAIMYHVPNRADFAGGDTIAEAVYSSFIPRFLDEDKKIAGGRDNFRRFTGLEINNNTSMGTSILGEAYANFGLEGAWLFMGSWAAFLGFTFVYLMRYAVRHPLLFFFLPLIFLQVIKAETELAVVLNHLVKSMIFVFGLFWIFRNFLGWRV